MRRQLEIRTSHAGGGHAPLEAAADVVDEPGLGDGVGPAAHGHAAVGAAVARVDDDALAREPGPGAVQALLLAQQARAPAGDLAAEVAEVTQGARPAHAVGGHAVVALEAAQGLLGLAAEHAVGAPGVVAELQETLLEREDVVPGEGGRRR